VQCRPCVWGHSVQPLTNAFGLLLLLLLLLSSDFEMQLDCERSYSHYSSFFCFSFFVAGLMLFCSLYFVAIITVVLKSVVSM